MSRVAINMHVTSIWWRGALTYGSHVSCVAINMHVTTIWWRGPSNMAHVCHMWQLTCMLLLYGGGEPSRVSHVAINVHITTIWWRGALTCGSYVEGSL